MECTDSDEENVEKKKEDREDENKEEDENDEGDNDDITQEEVCLYSQTRNSEMGVGGQQMDW